MKNNNSALYVLLLTTAMAVSCGTETKNEDSVPENKTETAAVTTVALKNILNEKQGYSIGLPEGWMLEDGGDVNGDLSYSVKRGEDYMFTIITGTKLDKDVTLPEMLETYGENDEISLKEDHAKNEGVERTGLIVKDKTSSDPLRNTTFEFFLFFKGGKFPYANITVNQASSTGAADTCYSIIKSITLIQ